MALERIPIGAQQNESLCMPYSRTCAEGLVTMISRGSSARLVYPPFLVMVSVEEASAVRTTAPRTSNAIDFAISSSRGLTTTALYHYNSTVVLWSTNSLLSWSSGERCRTTTTGESQCKRFFCVIVHNWVGWPQLSAVRSERWKSEKKSSSACIMVRRRLLNMERRVNGDPPISWKWIMKNEDSAQYVW